MLNVIDHHKGLKFSIKTFRPLWMFPWHSSIWRQFPMRNCLAVLKWKSKSLAESGHTDLTDFLSKLEFGEQMASIHDALEKKAKELTETGKVASYRLTESRDQANKMQIRVE